MWPYRVDSEQSVADLGSDAHTLYQLPPFTRDNYLARLSRCQNFSEHVYRLSSDQYIPRWENETREMDTIKCVKKQIWTGNAVREENAVSEDSTSVG